MENLNEFLSARNAIVGDLLIARRKGGRVVTFIVADLTKETVTFRSLEALALMDDDELLALWQPMSGGWMMPKLPTEKPRVKKDPEIFAGDVVDYGDGPHFFNGEEMVRSSDGKVTKDLKLDKVVRVWRDGTAIYRRNFA